MPRPLDIAARTAKMRATINAKNAALRDGIPPGAAEMRREEALEALKADQVRLREMPPPKKYKPRGIPFQKGVSPNPAGRPKGSGKKIKKINGIRSTWQSRGERCALIAQTGITPLEFMLAVVRNPEADPDLRLEAARSAAPYVHRKMPIAVEGGDPAKPIVFEASALGMLQPQEKMMLLTLVEKMALAMQPNKPTPQALIDSVAQREADADDLPEPPDA